MASPTDSVAPDAPTGSSTIAGAVKLWQWFAKITDWIKALSPTGASKYDTGWTTLSYGTGFSAQSFGRTPGHRRIGRVIRLRGVAVKSGNIDNGDVVGIIPAGYRPTAVIYVTAPGSAASSVPLQIQADGQILVRVAPTATTPWLSLDCITYEVD